MKGFAIDCFRLNFLIGVKGMEEKGKERKGKERWMGLEYSCECVTLRDFPDGGSYCLYEVGNVT